MKNLLFLFLLIISSSALAQFEAATRYRSIAADFYTAMDTLIGRAALDVSDSTEGGPLNKLTRFRYYMGGRVSNDVGVGEDMYWPMDAALTSFFSSFSSFCPGTGSGNWTCVGPFIDYYGGDEHIGRVDAIWVHPTDTNIILLGSNGGGLWKTTNGGHDWSNITDGAGSSASSVLAMAGVNKIAVNPLNTDIIYIGLGGRDESKKSGGYDLGLAYTTNGGTTWNQDIAFNTLVTTTGDHVARVSKIAYVPGTEKLFAISEQKVLYKASPSVSWTDITPASFPVSGTPWCFDMAFTQTSGKLIVTFSALLGTSYMCIYDPSSSVWTYVPLALTGYTQSDHDGAVKISVTVGDMVYMQFRVNDGNNSLLLRTPLSTFSPDIRNTAFSCWPAGTCSLEEVTDFQVSPVNSDIIYVANYNGYANNAIWKSTNGGASFPYSYNSHADGRCMVIYSATNTTDGINDVVYTGNDGGIRKKRYGVNNFESITGNGLCITEFFGFGNTESDDRIMTGGAQDNGGFAYMKNSSTPWQRIANGDGYTAKFYQNGERTALAEKNYPEVYGVSFGVSPISYGQSNPHDVAGTNINRPIYVDNNNIAYIGYHQIWINTLGTSAWTRFPVSQPVNMTSPAIAGRVVDFYMHEQDRNIMYIAYRDPASSSSTFKRLYYSNDALSTSPLPTWANITPSIALDNGINSIAVDPKNGSRIWVAFGNVNNNYVGASPDTMKKRVLYSSDYGSTWTDVSKGLSALPINKLLYRKGSNDEIYAGTDAGVFRWNTTLAKWECYNLGLPSCTVMDMEFNYCAGKLRIATHGRGIWETTLDPLTETSITPSNITGTPIWSNEQWLQNSITVKSGATLTISNTTIHMPRDGAIFVEAGAKLVVDHATITNDCSGCMWGGIVGYGHYAAAQAAANQATIIIQNGSVIKNANKAVSNYDPDPAYVPGTKGSGAIIQASQSTFLNNHNSVTFIPFNSAAALYAPNISYFDRCTFIIDTNYKMKLSNPMRNHVSLTSVDGVRFKGCKFINRNWSWHISGSWGYGEGIHAYDAGFRVLPYCPLTPPCTSPVRSYFSGLGHGIMIKGGFGSNPTVNIDRADFDSTAIGVHVSAQENVAVTRCYFNVGRGNNLDSAVEGYNECGNIGILIQNAAQFYQEENYFRGRKNYSPFAWTPWNNIGTLIANTGGYANKVYRSTFDSLTKGVLSVGNNRYNVYAGSPYTSGLKVLCNTFQHNTVDIMAVNYGAATIQGIAPHQGSLTRPAGNTFSGSTNNIVDYSSSGSINYFFDAANGATERPNVVSTSVWRDSVDFRKYCPEMISSLPSAGGKPAPTSLDRDVLTRHESIFFTAKAKLADSLHVYDSLIDNGNTNGLIGQIMQAQTYSSVSSTLASISPYLSTKVLMQTANKWGSDAGLRTSLANLYTSNPEALRNANLLDALTSAGWSQGDISGLLTASYTRTRRTALESAMDDARAAMDDEGNIIMMALKSPVDSDVSVDDSTGTGICTDTASIYYGTDSSAVYAYLDSVDTWLQHINDLWTIYARVGYYNYKGAYSIADSIMASPASMSLATEDQATYSTYSNLWARIYGAEQAGRTALTLNGQELALIDTFSDQDLYYNTGLQLVWNITTAMKEIIYGFPGRYGTPVICHVSVLHSSKPGRGNASAIGGSGGSIPGIEEIDDMQRFAVYPNPTSGVVTFAYNIPDANADITITITNVLGAKVAERKCSGSMGKVFWDPAGLSSGVYLYSATYGKGVISKGRIAVVR